MAHPTHLLRSCTPWRMVAAGLVVMMLTMSLVGRAEAASAVMAHVTDNGADNQTSQCPPGRFGFGGVEPCFPAPTGGYVPTAGSSRAFECTPGTFSNVTGLTTCIPAPIDTYVATAGATSATACPAGTRTTSTGATSEDQCVHLGQVSNVSFTSNNYREQATGAWTVEFTTSPTGALTTGDSISLTISGADLFGDTGSVSLGGDFVPGTDQTVGGTIVGQSPYSVTFPLLNGSSLGASQTGRITFTTTNPTARTIAASDITVTTTRDTIPGAATASVVIRRGNKPELDGLVVRPLILTSFADYLSVPVNRPDGQTALTVEVSAGRTYVILGGSNEHDVVHYLGAAAVPDGRFDPERTPLRAHAIGSTVTIRVTSATEPTNFTDYTVTLRALPKTQLAFDTQPAGAVANTALKTQPKVAILDAKGVRMAETDTVTLRIKEGTGTDRAVLTATSVPAVAGLATFTDVEIDQAGRGYVLEALSGGLKIAESDPFDVVPPPTAVTNVTVSAPPTAAQEATTVTVQFTPTTALGDGDSVTVTMAGYAFTPGAVTMTGAGEFSGRTTASVLAADPSTVVIRLTGGTIPAGTASTFSFQATPNPDVLVAGQPRTIARAGLTVRTSKDTAPGASGADIVVVPAITDALVTLSNTNASATRVTLRVSLTSPVALATGDRIVVKLPAGFSASTTTVTFAPTAVANAAAFANGELTVTLGASLGAGGVTFDATGFTNPDTAGAARFDIPFVVYASGSTSVRATTSAGTLPRIFDATSVRDLSITPSSTHAAATNVTMRVTFTPTISLRPGEEVRVTLPGFVLPGAVGASFSQLSPTALRLGGAATTTPANLSVSGNTMTAIIGAGATSLHTQSPVTLEITGLTNPAARTIAKAGLTVTTTMNTLPAAAAADIVIVEPPLTNASITLSDVSARATGVRMTVTFETLRDIPAGGGIIVQLPAGFSMPGNPAATFTMPGAPAPIASFDAPQLLLLVLAPIRAGTVTFVVTDVTNPAAQPGRNNIVIRTVADAFGAGTTVQETNQATLPAIVGQISGGAIRLSDATIGATGVTTRVELTTTQAIPAGGRVEVTMPGFSFTALEAAVIEFAGRKVPVSYADGKLTVTFPTGIPAGSVTFEVTGTRNPAAVQPAQTTALIRTATSTGTTIDQARTATLEANRPPAVRGVSFFPDDRAGNVETTLNVWFLPYTTLVPGDTITVSANGYSFTSADLARIANANEPAPQDGRGIVPKGSLFKFTSATISGATANEVTLTIPAGVSSLPAGEVIPLRLGVRNPVAGLIAGAGLTVHTSKDTTPVASSLDIEITPLQFSVHRGGTGTGYSNIDVTVVDSAGRPALKLPPTRVALTASGGLFDSCNSSSETHQGSVSFRCGYTGSGPTTFTFTAPGVRSLTLQYPGGFGFR